ncbi:MAG: hypothetical protein FWH33_08065 [Oscillospiraceae bacterium]|nr:hypothetical protein [Oscillospiraceae bacterium]
MALAVPFECFRITVNRLWILACGRLIIVPTTARCVNYNECVAIIVSSADIKAKEKRELMAPASLTDYEDNKMKKDNLATLHRYNSKQLLIKKQKVISKILSLQYFSKNFVKIL